MHRNWDGTEQKLITENNDQVKNNFKKISYERITNWEKNQLESLLASRSEHLIIIDPVPVITSRIILLKIYIQRF